MLIFLCIIATFLSVVNYVFNYNKVAKLMRKIPGFKFNFIVGNALEILVSPEELFVKARRWASVFPGIYGFYVYPTASVNIYNAEDVKIVLSSLKFHQKSIIYKLLRPWLQNGLLLSRGAKWQKRRKILTPTFHFNVLLKYYPTIIDNTSRFIEVLDNLKDRPVSLMPLVSEFTLNAICETAMGTKLNANKDGTLYKEAIHNITNVLYSRFVNVLLFWDFLFNLTPLKAKHTKLLTTIHNFTKSVIESRKLSLESKTGKDNREIKEDNENYGKERIAFLDLLLLAYKNGLTDEVGIQEEVDTFMFRGHDTVATAITFILLSLAEHKTVQDRVMSELRSIFGTDDRAATINDLSMMQYLECCIKESMRLYPPVPFISRKIPEDVTLSNYKVPKGAMCHIHIFDLHRQEDLFRNAEKYDPDRFLPENSVGRHPYAYVAFSAGPRNCIGQKFAMIEMKLVISAILRRFELIPVTRCKDIKFTADIILRTTAPIEIMFTKRI